MNPYEELKDVIENIPKNQPIIIAGHENADMDSLGASLAMAYFLNNIGKKDINVLIEEKDMYKISWFNSKKFITQDVQKSNYVFIIVDLNRKDRLGKFESYFDNAELTINIDHHENNKKESNYIIEEADISSTCEILFNLFSYFNCKLTKNIAELLYAGILTDTSCFSKRLTSKTLTIASNLLEYGIDYEYITKKTFSERTIKEINALAEILKNIQYDVFHYVIINKKEEVFSELEYSLLFKKVTPILKNIDEIKVIGIFLIDHDEIFGEFKSNIDIDLSKIAMQFGGGGHKDSSGFKTSLPLDEVLKISKEYMKKYI